MNVVLTLQAPDIERRQGLIIAATTNREMLLLFRRHILAENERRVRDAQDDTMKALFAIDYERVRLALDMTVPEEQ
jgi:hypothetical protein